MTLAARIGQAILWGQAGRLMEAAIVFLFSLLLARVLGPATYGLYALGISLAGILSFLSLLGLGPETLGRFLPEIASNGEGQQTQRLLHTLLVVRSAGIIFVACLAFVFRGAISARLHFPVVVASLGAVLLVFAARSVFDLLTYFSSGLLELRRVALAKLVAAAIAPGLFFPLFAFRRSGVDAAWVSIAAGSVAGTCILLFPLLPTREAGPSAGQALPIRRILVFGLFTWATNFFVYILGDSTDVLLLGWLTPDRAAIGRYAVGARVVFSLTNLLLGWAALVSVASLSEAYQRSGISGIARSVEAQWKLGCLCTIAPLLFLIRYARDIVTVLFSGAYTSSAVIVQILSVLMVCSALCGFSVHGGVLYALGRERSACTAVGAAAAFNLASEIVLVRRYGVPGAAWATGLSFVLLAVSCLALSSRYAPVSVPVDFLWKVSVAAAAALLSAGWFEPASIGTLAGIGAAYALVFFVTLALLKPLSTSDCVSLHSVNNVLGGCAKRFFTAAYASPSGDS